MFAYSLFLSQYKYQANIVRAGVKRSINNDDVLTAPTDRLSAIQKPHALMTITIKLARKLRLLIYRHKTRLIMNASA